MICCKCHKPFTPTVYEQTTCTSCMISPAAFKEGALKQFKAKDCSVCKEPFIPEAPRQQTCSKCRKAPGVKARPIVIPKIDIEPTEPVEEPVDESVAVEEALLSDFVRLCHAVAETEIKELSITVGHVSINIHNCRVPT